MMSKKWSYAFKVREHFLATKNWDRIYEPGESREVVIGFHQDENDDEKARQNIINRAEEEDIAVEILGFEKKEIEFPMSQNERFLV